MNSNQANGILCELSLWKKNFKKAWYWTELNLCLKHQGKLQHMAAELRGYKQAHTSPPPLTAGNSRVVESLASLKECGSKAQAVRVGEPDYL